MSNNYSQKRKKTKLKRRSLEDQKVVSALGKVSCKGCRLEKWFKCKINPNLVQQKDPVKYPTDYPGYVQFCDNFDDKHRRADTLAELEAPQEIKKGTKNKSNEEIQIIQTSLDQAAEGFQVVETVIFENYRKSQVLGQKVENFLSIFDFRGIKIRDDSVKLWTNDSKPKILSSIFCTIEYTKCFQFTRMLKHWERLKLLGYIATIFIVLNMSYLDLVKKIQNSNGN
ncbi:Protein CBG10530 [Caenorhabditis briggsae]|uniref:Protein CBG10530 n=1 Tax=Caenorhabditis briggsae TaxID=6238 RepID=A8XBE8_CAEBR|nr:Protein CBG10530 [Caenorhabditis briggsae]CAP29963.2 Protein CBG10530 [Caenorhabditis briggsae]